MKTKKNLFHQFPAAALTALAVAISSPLQAATFTWDGGSLTSNGWGNLENWDPDGAPTFDNTADLVFNVLTRPNNFIGGNRIIRSLSYGADIDGVFQTNYQDFSGGAARTLTMDADSGNATITVDAGSTGDITLGSAGGTGGIGTMILADNLDVVHNGTGQLFLNRGISGATFGITKTGTGTMALNSVGSSPNTFTGDININQGTLIANGFVVATDMNNAGKINLGGGTLEVSSVSGANKDYTTVPLEVNSASTLAYKNLSNTTYTLSFTGSPAFALNADLSVRNISINTTLTNLINLRRNITGTGDLIVDGYNTFTSSTSSFGLGRVALGGNNSGWSGDLVILRGSAEVYGDTAVGAFNAGTGDVILGETSNTAGAAFILSASTPTSGGKTLSNDIIVRAGGFRTLRGTSDHTYNINGNITLDGDLNVHNGLFFNDKNMILNGTISGEGDLNVTKAAAGGFTRLTGDNSLWSGDLMISQGALNLFGTVSTPGTGKIVLGATSDATAASLTFSHTSSLTYANDIIVNTGGTRTIQGNSGLGINVTFIGGVTLNGDLTIDHTWSTSDRRFNLNGPISGNGGLNVTRSGGNLETTLRMSGTKDYLGATTVGATASLALASDCVLTSSNVVVQATGRIGGPGTIDGNLTLDSSATFFFFVGSSTPRTYIPMKVNGNVAVDNSFGVASIVGGSRGEAVPWATIPDGTYTLISNTASTFNTTANFGPGNAVANVAGSGKTVYFQNGGGSGSGGLQIVVANAAADPFTTWSGGAAFNVDTNNDGISNGLAFLLGAGDVDENANGLLPKPTEIGGALRLTFSMRNAAARGTASLQVQHSSDLGITDLWSTLVTVPDADGTDPSGIVFDITEDTPLNGVIATIPASGNAAGGKLFGRVKSNP